VSPHTEQTQLEDLKQTARAGTDDDDFGLDGLCHDDSRRKP